MKFDSGFDITHSHNHWSNKELIIPLLKNIVISFILKKKDEALKLAENSKAFLINDVFMGQAPVYCE